MRINVTTVLKDFSGTPLKEGAEEFTVGRVLMTAAMSAPQQGQTYTPDEQVKRYQLGFGVHEAQESAKAGLTGDDDIGVEIDSDTATRLKADIARMFGPIVAGQMMPILDGR